MRLIPFLALAFSATTALAEDAAPIDGGGLLGGVSVNTSYSLSGPLSAKNQADLALEEQTYRKNMYLQSAKECADLLDTIAKSCAIANITVSTQITRQAGIADQMYASGSVTLQVELK